MDEKLSGKELLEELQESVKNNFRGFFINYQPQVHADSYEIYGVEALARYNSKNGIRIFPDEFIPILEQSRLIEQVGLCILEKALEQCCIWRKKIADFKVSVNFSAIQFERDGIGEEIFKILKKTNMPGNALAIEITESVQLKDPDLFSRIISTLKKEGIKISLDDFGKGCSNIDYLKKFDVDEVKIDRSLVKDIRENTENYKAIADLMQFAKDNAIQVCCEGIETEQELNVIKQFMPNRLQGYLFDRPAEAEYITKVYTQKDSEEYKARERFISSLR